MQNWPLSHSAGISKPDSTSAFSPRKGEKVSVVTSYQGSSHESSHPKVYSCESSQCQWLHLSLQFEFESMASLDSSQWLRKLYGEQKMNKNVFKNFPTSILQYNAMQCDAMRCDTCQKAA